MTVNYLIKGINKKELRQLWNKIQLLVQPFIFMCTLGIELNEHAYEYEHVYGYALRLLGNKLD
jgi:hypothetical protein